MTDSTPEGNGSVTEQLYVVRTAVEYFMTVLNEDGQTQGLTLEMSQRMLSDVIETDGLAPLVEYVKRYCDVIDGPEAAECIAAEITAADI